MIDKSDTPYARLMLEVKLRDDTGTLFEDFYQRVASGAFGSDFVASIAMGRRGDLKCDGYLLNSRTVHQAYAPRRMQVDPLLKKIKTDFIGARLHWKDEMKAWRFVHNSEQLPSEAIRLIAQIKTKYPNCNVGLVPPSEIVDLALTLSRDKLEAIIGRIPSVSELRKLNFEEIDALMVAIEGVEVIPNLDTPAIPSADKLKHNALSSYLVDLLRTQELVTKRFHAYFSDTARNEVGNKAAEKIRNEYRRLKGIGYSSDGIFFGLAEYAGGLDGTDSRRKTLLGFLAYLFFACEIFEDVPKTDVPKQ